MDYSECSVWHGQRDVIIASSRSAIWSRLAEDEESLMSLARLCLKPTAACKIKEHRGPSVRREIASTIDGSMTFANCEVFGFSAIRSLGNNATAVRSDPRRPLSLVQADPTSSNGLLGE